DTGPQLIEVGARLGGDFIATHLTPLSTGVDMVDAIIAIATGQPCPVTPKPLRVSAVRFGHVPVAPNAALPAALQQDALDRSGADEVGLLGGSSSLSPTSSVERGAYAIAVGATRDEALQHCT